MSLGRRLLARLKVDAGRVEKLIPEGTSGTMTRRLPSRSTVTCFTSSGNATSFGKRTACDRFEWKMVVRTMATLLACER